MRLAIGIAILTWTVGAAAVGAVERVTPGGEIRAMAAHPTQPERLLLVTDLDELVVVDAGLGEILERVPLPGTAAGGLAIEPDGRRAWVGLQAPSAVVALDLDSLMAEAPVPLSSSHIPSDLVLPRPGRLIASVGRDGLSIVDTAAAAEVVLHPDPGYASDLALRSDGAVLYALDQGVSPTSLYAFDVRGDVPVWIGEDCCHGCVGSNGRQVAVSTDDSRLFVATGAPYYVNVLDAVGLFHQVSSVLTSSYPNAVAVSPDGSRLYVGHQQSSVLVADAATGLALKRQPLPGHVGAGGLEVAVDGSWIAAAHEDGGFDVVSVSLFEAAELEGAELGSVSLRAIDPVTNEPVAAWLTSVGSVLGSTWDWRDLPEGRIAWGPAPPGRHELRLRTSLPHEEVPLSVDVVAGEWTDLGDIVLTRTVPEHPEPDGACMEPPLVPGLRMEARVHGMNYVDGPGLVLRLPSTVTLHSYEWEAWGTIRADVTADPSVASGRYSGLRVVNPDGSFQDGSFAVADWPELDPSADRIPPAEVHRLYVNKREDRLPGFLMEWTEVTLQEDGSPETMGDYQVLRDEVAMGESADFDGAVLWVETPELSYLWSPPPDGELGPFVTLRVRARDAAGNLGPLASP